MISTHELTPTLFRHARRPEWGLAILESETPQHRRFQFQDGQLRTFRKGFYELLEPQDRPLDESLRIAERLEAARDMSLAREEVLETSEVPVVKLVDQIDHFKSIYPAGFADPGYEEMARGEGASRRLKRHREQLIATARDALAADRLREWLAAPEDMTPMREALMKVMKATDLVQRSEIDVIDALSHSALADIARVLLALWEDDANPSPDFDLEAKFDALVEALTIGDAEPRWCLPTTLLASLFPDSFPPVRHAIYREQARWMAPRLKLARAPSGRQYLRLRGMATLVRQKLAQQALVARDLFDVWDFMWETLRPKARRELVG
jgi:hypothetical protein